MNRCQATTTEPLYVVRQHWLTFVVFIAGGALFLVGPWVPGVEFQGHLWARLIFSILGLLALLLGIHGMRTQRIAVILDAVGIQPRCLTGNAEIVPWCEVSGVKKVSYTSPEGTHEGVVVGLNSAEHFPYGREHTEHITREIKKLIPTDEFDVCFVLTHDDWDWNIDEFLNVARRCLSDCGGECRSSLVEPSASQARAT